MITLEKLNTYKSYNGDIDGWARSGPSWQKQVMTDEDWFLIENLIQDLTLVQRGLAAPDFIENLNNRLKDKCNDGSYYSGIKGCSEIGVPFSIDKRCLEAQTPKPLPISKVSN